MSGTIEVDRRTRRRYDTQLATTYQLDHVRRERGLRAIVVATEDGHMLAGSMGEPIARALAIYTGMAGAADDTQRDVVLRAFAAEHLDGEEDTLHIREFDLGGVPVYLGIVAGREAELEAPAKRVIDGVQRIFSTT